MSNEKIARDYVPTQFVLGVDHVTADAWLAAGNGPLERALCRVLGSRAQTAATVHELLPAFIREYDGIFAHSEGARNRLDREWRALWKAGRLVERDGAVCFGDAIF